jgi:hypothetical protein
MERTVNREVRVHPGGEAVFFAAARSKIHWNPRLPAAIAAFIQATGRSQGDEVMRTAVAILNVLSFLVSLLMLWLGSGMVLQGLDRLKYDEYKELPLGFVLVAAFLIAPAICVIASTKLARAGGGWAILVALVPVLVAVLMIPVVLNTMVINYIR